MERGQRTHLLLRKTSFFDDCPGCKLEMRKAQWRGGTPKKELFALSILVLCNVLPMSSVFSYMYFLAKSFPIVKSDEDIGFYAGLVDSSFTLGRFLTSSFWGFIADKYGRKPVFIIGILAIVVFNTLFGFSRGFWTAFTSRFLLGCLNGILGPVRAYASELCDHENQAFALSLVGTVWGLGLVIGPALGGYLAQPSIKYPSIFPKGGLFDEFPFLLPPLTISAFAVVAFFIALTLPESLHNHQAQEGTTGRENSEESIPGLGETNSDHERETNEHGETSENQEEENPSLFTNKAMWASIVVYCLWALHDMAYIETFSLWALSPPMYDGLGFSTSDVGLVLAISGFFLLVFQLLVFPLLANMAENIMITRIPAILTLPLLLAFPLIARLHGISLWVILISASVAKNLFSSCTTTGSFLLINNAVTMKERGFANRVSVSGMFLFKAIGPASAGALFSWSQRRLDASFLPGTWMVFTILSITCLVVVIATFEPIMPRSSEQLMEIQSYEEEQLVKRSASFMED